MTDSSAVNMTVGPQFFETVVENHGLKDVVVPAPVELPTNDTPRAGGVNLPAELGPLKELPGAWIGNGFNLIARPAKQEGRPFFLELNATKEILEFTAISGPIPNRGSRQDDITYLGLNYLQRVSDSFTNGGLHIEPGLWLNIPPTTVPHAGATVVRLATIPHGNSLLAQGQGFTVKGGPQIQTISSTPTKANGQPLGHEHLGYLDPFLNTPPRLGSQKGRSPIRTSSSPTRSRARTSPKRWCW